MAFTPNYLTPRVHYTPKNVTPRCMITPRLPNSLDYLRKFYTH